MPFKDAGTIFSRAFFVGYYLPPFLALCVLWQGLSEEAVPDALEAYSGATQLLVLAALAIPAGLLLSTMNYSLLRWYEGYPLEQHRHRPVVRQVYEWLVGARKAEFQKLESGRQANDSGAIWQQIRLFPNASLILPTRFGNAVRAFEYHAARMYELSSIGCWPRIELLLSATESSAVQEAKADADFLVNASALSYLVGLVLLVDVGVNRADAWDVWLLCLIPLIVGYWLYRLAVAAAIRWGSVVRACVDIHRFDLYEKFGLKRPHSKAEESKVAQALTQALLYGTKLPNAVRAQPEPPPPPGTGDQPLAGALASLITQLRRKDGL